jgi:hypothetical protein
MLNFLTDACGSIYCLHRPHEGNLHDLGEAFDQRDDWQPAVPAPIAMKGAAVIAVCSLLLATGLVLAV